MRQSLAYISRHPLTQDGCFFAYSRYFLFHIRHILNHNRPKIYQFVGDIKYFASIGEAGILGNIYTGLDDFEEMSFLLHFLRSDDVFLDVGANVGAYSLLASGICQSKTIAIEPIPATFQRLKANVKLNILDHFIECVNIGLGSQAGRLDFIDSPHSEMNRVAIVNESSAYHQVTINVRPVDHIVSEKAFPALIKIDVEGFEIEVLKGAFQCLKDMRLKALIIELNGSGEKYGYTDEQVMSALIAERFAPYRYEPFSRELVPLDGKDKAKFNTIFVRDHDDVLAKLKTAPEFKVLSYWI